MSGNHLRRLFVSGAMTGALVAWAFPAEAQGATSDSIAVTSAVSRYHDALSRGDSLAALALLTPTAVILESGEFETRDQYRKGHLPADIGFAAAVPSRRTVGRVTIRGDMAWVASSSVTRGKMRGRAINSAGAELMVLERNVEGWRISAIHWSSHPLKSSAP